jgi:hypothetical protein
MKESGSGWFALGQAPDDGRHPWSAATCASFVLTIDTFLAQVSDLRQLSVAQEAVA